MSESRGCPSFKASNVEGVVAYPDPLATQKMECPRLSRRVNKMGFKIDFYNSLRMKYKNTLLICIKAMISRI
jgi:hypothetical protein